MREVKILFTRSIKKINILSRLIQEYENLPISHCALELVTPNLGTNIIYHSSGSGGVTIVAKEHFLKKNEIMEEYQIFIEDDQFKILRNILLSNCGIEYGLFQNIGILIVDVLNRLGLKINNPWKEGFNCSEALYISIIPMICKDMPKTDQNIVKPSDIRQILENNGFNPIYSKIVK